MDARKQVFSLVVRKTALWLLIMAASFVIAQPYQEAPQLKERVEAGDLPPVEERLPENPLVVEPYEEVGQYGGTWNLIMIGATPSLLRPVIGYENLVRWDPEWTQVIPNIAESLDVNDEGTEFTFHLRQGMRWSDGQPFTADDIMFWYEDVAMNETLSPGGLPAWMHVGGEVGVVEKIDDYTVVFRFAAPHGLFLDRLASVDGFAPTSYPRHYLEQFHMTYNPDGIEALMQQENVETWAGLFELKGGSYVVASGWGNADRPSLYPWQLTAPLGVGTAVVAERNPYYWKVDTAGNQLPYLDRVDFPYVETGEVVLLRALAGEIDFLYHGPTTPSNKALFFDNMDRGNYDFFDLVPSHMNLLIISLNLTHQDPIMNEVLNNKDFRIGLSYAIDRQEIIDLVYVGQGEPWQAGPRPESPLYNERLAKQYTEYDPDLANEYLDRAGYTERDAEGFRLAPDGRRISIIFEYTESQTHTDALELIKDSWQQVGVEIHLRPMHWSLKGERLSANLQDATVSSGPGGLEVMLDPRYYFPYNNNSDFAMAWQAWYNTPEIPLAQEPPEAVKRQMTLYDRLLATADRDEQNQLMHEILEIAADEFHVIGVVLPGMNYGIIKNDLRNVRPSMPDNWLYQRPGPTNPEQYFKEQ